MANYDRRGLKIKHLDSPKYDVDKSLVQRYDQKNLIFNWVSNDPH